MEDKKNEPPDFVSRSEVSLKWRVLEDLQGLLEHVNVTSYAKDEKMELCAILVPLVQKAHDDLEKLLKIHC